MTTSSTHLPGQREVKFVVPVSEMRRICERARREWGPDAEEMPTPRHAIVKFWLGRTVHYQHGHAPVGQFSVHWHTPNDPLATIDRIEWDPAQGGSEAEVYEVINTLAGWPLAH